VFAVIKADRNREEAIQAPRPRRVFERKERLPDVLPSGTVSQNAEGAAMVLADGEARGHCDAIRERVTMFRNDSLPR
jgi:hypothetical protein